MNTTSTHAVVPLCELVAVLSSQFVDRRRCAHSPEMRLVAAMFEDAVRSVVRNTSARRGPRRREFIPAADALIMAEAIVRLWPRCGERKNRKRARMKYLFQRLGAARFIARVNELYAEIGARQGAALRAELHEVVVGFGTSGPGNPLARAATSALWQ